MTICSCGAVVAHVNHAQPLADQLCGKCSAVKRGAVLTADGKLKTPPGILAYLEAAIATPEDLHEMARKCARSAYD